MRHSSRSAPPTPTPTPTQTQTLIIGLAFIVLLALAGCESGGLAPENAYPSRPITIVVTFPPGGGTDLLAREIGAQLATDLGQPVIIENVPGASGNIGAAQVAQAPADGYRLLMVNSSFAINPGVFNNLNFSPKDDLIAVVNVGWIPSLWIVPIDSPFTRIDEVLSSTQASSLSLPYASCGNGTPQHLAGEMLKQHVSVNLLQIPYRGCGPAVVDVMAGQVGLGVVTAASAAPYLGTRLRALATTAAQRGGPLPDVPTVAESGLNGYVMNQWHGLLAPAGTPQTVVNQLNEAVNAIVARPAMQQKLIQLGYSPESTSALAFQTLVHRDIDRFSEISAVAKIRLN